MTQPIAGGAYYVEGQDLGHSTINEHFNRAAHTGFLIVQSKSLTAPPGGESNGQAWIVGGSATAAWLGHDNEVALYYDGWIFRDMPVGEVFTDLSTGTNGTVYVKDAVTPTYTSVQAF